jgi:uncharacterized membrane protein (UPF0127 family)
MGRRRLVVVGAAVAVAGAVAAGCIVWLGGSGGRDPNATPAPSRIAGFDQIAFRVGGPTRSGPSGPPHCALLARTSAQQQTGLMFRRDLAGYAGMVFQWPHPATDEFYMKNTLIPLSIAWFDQAGRFVSAADMTPCPPGAACPLYAAAAPYTIALEVPRGGLAGLGIGPGASFALDGSCR